MGRFVELNNRENQKKEKAPASGGGRFVQIGDTSKIGAYTGTKFGQVEKKSAPTAGASPQKKTTPATAPAKKQRSLPMDNVGRKNTANSRLLQDIQKREVAAPSIGKNRSNQYSLRKGLESVVLKGGQQVAQAAGNTAALAEDLVLAPFEFFSGQELGSLSDNAPFNTWARGIQRNGQELQDKYAGNIAKGGKAAELLDKYGASTVAAVPQAVLAMLTSGGSMAASTAGVSSAAAAELAPGVASTIRRSIATAAKDPQYWLSFGQVVGDGYESALQDMQASGKYDNNTARTKAALYAIGNGILNAEVEVGGGIQKLPEELKHGAAAWKAWVDSMVDEGKEEVVQGIGDSIDCRITFFDHAVSEPMMYVIMAGSIAVLIAAYVLRRTRVGLHLRAVGENPATADAAGINVTKYKYLATCIGSMIAGLGGLYYVMDYACGVWSNNAFGDRGWLAIALVIFTIWRPNVSVLASILFGGFYILYIFIPTGTNLAIKELYKMLPYVVTLVVLIIVSLRKKREDQPPASLGLSYFREER